MQTTPEGRCSPGLSACGAPDGMSSGKIFSRHGMGHGNIRWNNRLSEGMY